MTVSDPAKFGFTLSTYAETLRAFRAEGYAVTSFRDYLRDPQAKHLVMRHDIDNSLQQAMRVARVDAEEGCTSSFYVRVHALGYNLLSLPSLLAIREMEDLGHEVQLHLEGGIGPVVGGDELAWAERQRTIFEAAVGRKLGGFSVHEPARMGGIAFANDLLTRWGDDVAYHAYEDRFMMPHMKYLSDSSGSWREGHFRHWVGEEPVLHVLTHPIWWFEHSPAENY